MAGLANNVTFGGTNWLRKKLYGDTATQNHEGAFYQGGEVAGEVATSLLPTGAFKGAKWAQQAVGGYNKARNIYERFQDVSDKVGSINNILNGCGGLEDLQNLAGGSFNPLGQIKQPSTVLGINSGDGLILSSETKRRLDISRSKKSPNGFKPDMLSQAIDHHYEDQVRAKTGGVSGYINKREIDSITNNALIEVKRSFGVIDNPKSFLKQKSKQIKATIASAEEQGKRAEFWYKYGVHPDVRKYIESKGGIVRTGLGD